MDPTIQDVEVTVNSWWGASFCTAFLCVAESPAECGYEGDSLAEQVVLMGLMPPMAPMPLLPTMTTLGGAEASGSGEPTLAVVAASRMARVASVAVATFWSAGDWRCPHERRCVRWTGRESRRALDLVVAVGAGQGCPEARAKVGRASCVRTSARLG